MIINEEDILYRDKLIRDFINGKTWDENPEFLIVKEVINNLGTRRPKLNEFKYIYDYEWEVKYGETHKGKGDLIMTNNLGDYLIMECKNKHSHEVRRQVLKYMKIFREKFPKCNKIKGLAVTPKDWDYITEDTTFWSVEIKEGEEEYYEFFNDLENPAEIELRDKLQKSYLEIGYYPANPINALQELKDKSVLSSIEYIEPNRVNPPFKYEIKVKVLSNLPEKEYYSKYESYEKKKLVIAIAAAKICEQIYLPYHMRDWNYQIKHIE